MSYKTAADLYAAEVWDSPLRRLARQVVKQREIIRNFRKDRRRWLYGSGPIPRAPSSPEADSMKEKP